MKCTPNFVHFNRWAKSRTTKAGIKINTRFDYSMKCANWLFITNSNKNENYTLKDMRLGEGDVAVFDRGYFNKRRFLDFTSSAISFVTRNKRNIEHETLSSNSEEKSVESFPIGHDKTIRMQVEKSKKKRAFMSPCASLSPMTRTRRRKSPS